MFSFIFEIYFTERLASRFEVKLVHVRRIANDDVVKGRNFSFTLSELVSLRVRVESDHNLPKLLTYVTRPNIAVYNLGRLAPDNERL